MRNIKGFGLAEGLLTVVPLTAVAFTVWQVNQTKGVVSNSEETFQQAEAGI